MPERDPLSALSQVLRSVDAVRNLRALYVLLATFSVAGLLLAMAETSLGRDSAGWGGFEAAAALFVAFYGGNTAGILVMDDARGGPVRDVAQALRAALTTAHRLLLALAVVAAGCAAVGVLLLGLLWVSRGAISGGWLGPVLFGIALPVGVVVVGGIVLALVGVVVPLAAPAVWAGADVRTLLGTLARTVRHRLLTVLLLMAAVSLLSAGVGAVASMVVMVGGRVVAELGVRVVGIEVPAKQLMAGLFGYGLRSLAAAGAPAGATGHAGAALVGGGVVFALALLLPGLVYLRGTCAVYLAMADEPPPSH
ncbi:MAG TPA: hypothetical protein VNU71_08560 [Burkholderiaceae bacterium]|nr:hypothetical protein [Burkholderiaceae bacterium]